MDVLGRRPGPGVPPNERETIVDDQGTKPAAEQGFPPMMKEMMERMCGGHACSPADMCQTMMSRMCGGSNRPAQGTPEGQRPDEKA